MNKHLIYKTIFKPSINKSSIYRSHPLSFSKIDLSFHRLNSIDTKYRSFHSGNIFPKTDEDYRKIVRTIINELLLSKSLYKHFGFRLKNE